MGRRRSKQRKHSYKSEGNELRSLSELRWKIISCYGLQDRVWKCRVVSSGSEQSSIRSYNHIEP
jgi:hypothetical protein